MSRTLKEEIDFCFPRNDKGIGIPLNIDIDGTVIYHGYAVDEKDFKINGKSLEILKRWVEQYNCLINIYTTRDGEKLEEVIRLFQTHNVPFSSVVSTSDWQGRWTTSKKQYGFVIDDMSATKIFYDENGRPTVDWDWLVETFEPRLQHMFNLIQELNQEKKS